MINLDLNIKYLSYDLDKKNSHFMHNVQWTYDIEKIDYIIYCV
jgi:hypothetical protein